MADQLGLLSSVKDRAEETFMKIKDLRSIRVRNKDATLAACLYIAYRQEDKPRTFKEICSGTNGTSIKQIVSATELIVKHLEEEMGVIRAGNFLRRFCSHLGMNNNDVRAADHVEKGSELLDVRRDSISIAATAIYIISQLSCQTKQLEEWLQEISLVTGVSESTIISVFKELVPYATKLIPDWFAKAALLPINTIFGTVSPGNNK